MVKAVILGATGRMGQANIRSAFQDKEIAIVGVIEAPSNPYIGKDAGLLAGCGELKLPLSANLSECLPQADVVIDFTTPKATLTSLKLNLTHRKGFIIGTTGFTDSEREQINEYASQFPIVLSPNFSIGVNVLFKLTELAATLLNKEKGYDLEIFEAHHRFKKDAPSGTALRLAEIAANFSGRDLEKDARYGRQGITGERSIDDIGMLTMRAGDIVGEHKLTFCTLGERIELGHIAHNRETFSKGAVLAAKWLNGKSSGLYSMTDVLGF